MPKLSSVSHETSNAFAVSQVSAEPSFKNINLRCVLRATNSVIK